MNNDYISDISWKYLCQYFTGTLSLFRYYQDLFLQQYGMEISGKIIEIGGVRSYRYQQYFPNATEYVVTNITGDIDFDLDVTHMCDIADNSQDAFVCVSVLEHVSSLTRAASELQRTLKPGGKILITVPFAVPYHDQVDYWRLNRDAFAILFPDLEILHLVHLGGTFSSIINTLQRPKGNIRSRYLLYKSIGFAVGLLGRHLDVKDGFPLGYGVYATKR